ncbi:TAXI family TRAP transporter solute-binding subunit [Denitrobaculum tricleocarpae]|uniref:TAXI family TRAP transporter solute-binding subunit n=1 Tax=Denitrobaculum tricleocarpae TaxID=2591009 RepID=A0A545TQ22_9PROT|nr:TAXI family TRAP transporter solute-binding subunit [Denitrobaculum tricleocarpae]TQV79322.1 TAXI family TRAP transporter solute-binding subunit [Denitrobaculum tricleocarpae]
MLRRLFRTIIGGLVLLAAGSAHAADDLREQINKGTVSIISGGINGTYIRIATDLASVLDNNEDLRVLPIMGKGSVQNIDDILYLRGIDIGIVQSDVFAFVKESNRHPTIDNRVHYITKLYNEEFHLLVSKDIKSVEDLAGKKVNFGVRGSGTFMTASIVFDRLGVAPEPVSFDQGLALEKVKSGEIAGLVYVAGKPAQLFNSFEAGNGLQLLPIPLTEKILETYLPSRFSHDDYPQLIAEGEAVKTLAVGAVMAVYNWPQDHPRRQKTINFIDAFFSKFAEFQQAPRHRKWREVSLTAVVPGWNRYQPAEDWLAKNIVAGDETDSSKTAFEAFLASQESSLSEKLSDDASKEELFKLFQLWQASQSQ